MTVYMIAALLCYIVILYDCLLLSLHLFTCMKHGYQIGPVSFTYSLLCACFFKKLWVIFVRLGKWFPLIMEATYFICELFHRNCRHLENASFSFIDRDKTVQCLTALYFTTSDITAC